MGGSHSIFYPDNGHRKDRAQQLANDCQDYSKEFTTKKADLEAQLGPYKDKIEKVMKAFGCDDLDDLSKMVQQNATGKVLEEWNKVKDVYDKTQIVDQVIYGAMGVVAIAGLTISSVGALAGGIGFFAGLAVTADILLVLGVIGALFDIINGAIQRSKLRDAINSLSESRIKVKHAVVHLDNLFVWMPVIEIIYQSFEEAGYDRNQIIQLLQRKGIPQPVASDMKDETFYRCASDLHQMDSDRGSWTNEDPNWEDIARRLDASNAPRAAAFASILPSVRTLVNMAPPSGPPLDRQYTVTSSVDMPTPYDTNIRVKLSPVDRAPLLDILAQPLQLSLHTFVDGLTARVEIRPDREHVLAVDPRGQIRSINAPPEHDMSKDWLISFANPADADRFGNGPQNIDPKTAVAVVLRLPRAQLHFLVGDGSLTDEEGSATRFLATRA